MFQFNLKKISILAASFAVFALSACKKETPHHNHDNEEYDKVKVHLVALNDADLPTTDTVTIIYDAHGLATPAQSNIVANTTYRMFIELYAQEQKINQEIIDDASAHQFFFFANPISSVSNYTYMDDRIGLDGKISFVNTGIIQLQVLLRHGLNKSHADAQNYNSANYQNAGGSNDLNITLNLMAN